MAELDSQDSRSSLEKDIIVAKLGNKFTQIVIEESKITENII